MIKVKEDNKKTIEIQQSIKSNIKRVSIIELSYPKSLDFKKTYSPSEYFNKYVSQKKVFFRGKNPSLHILYTKYLEEKTDNTEKLLKSLSLFSFHYLQKIKDYEYIFSKTKENDLLEEVLNALIDVQKTLNSFRDLSFKETIVINSFKKIDSLLSFESEQFILSMVSLLQKTKDSSEFRKILLEHAYQEDKYRLDNKYNSDDGNLKLHKDNDEQFVRILNRMDMRKKIAELPLKITEKVKKSGKKEKYISLAISTGIIMFLISFILMQVRMLGFDSTIQFVIGLAFLYIIRDLFREEFKAALYNKIISKSPIWKSKIFFPENKESVGDSRIWFYKEEEKASDSITSYKDSSSLVINESLRFNEFDYFGFSKLKTYTRIDLSPIMSEIKRDVRKLYIYPSENDSPDTVKRLNIPRQYKLDLTIKELSITRLGLKQVFSLDHVIKEKKYTVLINRDRIVKIEEKTVKK